ncbi:two-component system response regulator OmpR [Chitinimonas sp.]|uniref:osmolarity response regulator transcription factor OmpR n=1 Tax=Chitinimonas sp. TaxID=1934313 RepID=UPI002F93DED4
MSNSYDLLLIDDDPELRSMIKQYLEKHGHTVTVMADASQLERRINRQRPHLLILDLMLPGESGLTVCQRLRGQGEDLPILMLTARGDEIDRIIGLEMGADDYLGKPFNPRELLARIEAILRRHSQRAPAGAPDPEGGVVAFGDCELDLSTRRLTRAGAPVPLTSGEFSLLAVLVRHPHRPLSRERLVELARGREAEAFERSMDVQVSRLRKLIEPDPATPRLIQTVWGFGYVFVPDGEAR